MSCPLCQQRKAKRRCPALQQQICSVCCATKRQVEIHCPPDCTHLVSARHHPPAVVQRQHERDVRAIAPFLSSTTERQYALVLWLHAATAPYRSTAIPSVLDVDVAAATASLAATLETAERGIIYDHPTTTVVAQRLVDEFRKAITHVEGDRPGRLAKDAAAALRVLERLSVGMAKSDPNPKAALELLDRLVGPRSRTDTGPSGAPDGEAEPHETPRIVLS